MATSTVVPATQAVTPPPAPAKKPTWLSSVTVRVKNFFHKAAPIVEKVTAVAVQEEPVIDAALVATGFGPAAPLFNTIADAAEKAELAAAAIGSQNGTGAQKAALVVSNPDVLNAFRTFETAGGVSQHTQDQQKAIIALAVGFLNALNATPATPPSA